MGFLNRLLYSLPEHDQVHGFLGQVVVLLQVALHHHAQLLDVSHLDVVGAVGLWVREITVHQAAQVVFRHLRIIGVKLEPDLDPLSLRGTSIRSLGQLDQEVAD